MVSSACCIEVATSARTLVVATSTNAIVLATSTNNIAVATSTSTTERKHGKNKLHGLCGVKFFSLFFTRQICQFLNIKFTLFCHDFKFVVIYEFFSPPNLHSQNFRAHKKMCFSKSVQRWQLLLGL